MRKNHESMRRTVYICRALFFVVVAVAASKVFSQDLAGFEETLSKGNIEQKRDALMQLRSYRSEAASRIAVLALKDTNAVVRATAASAVLFLPPGEAVAALSPLLSDKDEFVRREGAAALGETREPTAGALLNSALTNDKSPEVKTAAAIALGKTGDPASVNILTRMLNDKPSEENEMFRRAVVRSIGQIAQIMRGGTARVLTPQNFLPESFKDVDSAPTAALLTHFADAQRVLVRLLDSTQEADDARREAAFSLGSIGDPASMAILNKYISSPDPYMAEIAKEALLKLRRPQ